METYVFKFSACLAVFWLVYVLFLERQNMHRFKRFYLLAAAILALIIPVLTITHYVEPIVQDFEMSSMFIPMESSFEALPQELPPFMDLETALWMLYGLGVLLFSIRFMVNLFKMYKRISKNETIAKHSFIYVLLEECRIPHSFFKYIFFSKLKYEADTIPKEVLLHEETHAKQLHSIDIIIIELLQIVFWFHPLIYILKHHIKLNHEFLADQAVLKQGSDTKAYQNILLQFSSNAHDYQLSSALNYSSIKKRFTVMKTNTSKTRIWISSLLLLPIIAILFYSFAEKEYVEKENTDLVQEIKDELRKADALEMIYVDGASEKLMQEYRDFISKFSDTNVIIIQKYERAVIIYDELMSEAQRNSVEKYPQRLIPQPNLSKTKPKKPSTTQFEAFKNADVYAIWVDGKHVSNSTLNNYSANDFVHFSGSIVHKNARSAKFPQPNQYHLYTKTGFKSTYQDSQLNRYKKATTKYSNAISNYLKGSQIENSELKILKAQADKIYTTFTKEELKKYNILPTQVVPTVKQEDPIKILKTNKNKSITLLEHWYITIDNNKYYYPYKKGDLKKYYDKYGNEIDLDIVKEYLKKHKTFETLKNTGKHYVYKSKEEQKKIEHLFSDLGGMYFRMLRKNKAKVERPISPVRPYVKITLNGKTYYKKYEELTAEEKATLPPPPPPPTKNSKGGPNIEDTQDIYNPSFLEYILEMEQQGASFYLDEEKISIKKAKSIATNNKGKSTEMLTQKDANGNYVVKLSSATKNNRYARSIDLKILKDGSYIIDGIKATKRTFTGVFNQLHQDITPEVRNKIMNIHVSSSKEISNKETWFIYNSLQDYGFYRIVTPNQDINRVKGNTPFAIESGFSGQQKATAKQVSAYNAWAKKIHSESTTISGNAKLLPIIDEQNLIKFSAIYNRMSEQQKKQAVEYPFPGLDVKDSDEKISISPKTIQQKATTKQVAAYNAWVKQLNASDHKIIKQKDLKKYKYIYGIMSAEQKKSSESFPKLPPPPPPPTKAKTYKNGKKLTLNEIIKQTPKGVESGYELLENGESHYYTVHKGEKTYYDKDGYITDKKGKVLPPPPPPPAPESTLDFVIRMAKANAKFYYKGKSISSDKAISLIKKNNKLNINAKEKDSNGKPLVYISNKPILIGVKGKDSKKERGGPNPGDLNEKFYVSEIKEEYIKKFKQYETLRHEKPHFLHKSKADKNKMNNLWLELRKHYIYKLSKTEQKSVELPTAPRLPYIKINKDGKSYFKVYNHLTPEEEKTMMFSPKSSPKMIETLELIDESNPIVIPIGTYTLEKEESVKKTETKRSVYITISEDGIYSISKDNTFKNFEPVSLKTLESVIAKLSSYEIKNTFVFAQNKDYKKFRSKPAKSPEYQDDIEVYLIKDDIRFNTLEYNGKYREHPVYKSVLDNRTSEKLKSHVSKLAELFKKYGITNLTL